MRPAAHRAAVLDYLAACYPPDSQRADDDLVCDAGWAASDALAALVACRPTTLPGVIAMLEHLGEPDFGHDPEVTLLVGAIDATEEIKGAVSKLPHILAQTLRSLA
jgi:hypothetical protein